MSAYAAQATPSADLIYVEVPGTTAILGGRRGTVTALHHSPIDRSVDGAFIGWDDGGTAYVTTGRHAGELRRHGGYTHREVDAVRDIGRDEFDVLSGLAAMRTQLGWRA